METIVARRVRGKSVHFSVTIKIVENLAVDSGVHLNAQGKAVERAVRGPLPFCKRICVSEHLTTLRQLSVL